MASRLSQSAVLTGLSKVPPFPPIAARLLVLLGHEPVDISELEELVGSDPTFSARLLRCVNSAEFGLPYPVGDMRRAISLLGLDRTRQIIVTLATASYSRLGTAELRRCWEHTLATAILADQIAQACQAFCDIAYTAGIIHDIGRLGLLVAYPKEYESIIREAGSRCLDLLDFEAEQFGVHHAEAGRILAERWNLPEDLRVVAGRHHDSCQGEEIDLLRIVHIACRLADSLGFEITRPVAPRSFDQVLAELPDQVRQCITFSPDELRVRIEQRIRTHEQSEEEPGEIAPGATDADAHWPGQSVAPEQSVSEDARLGARMVAAVLVAFALAGLLLRAFL